MDGVDEVYQFAADMGGARIHLHRRATMPTSLHIGKHQSSTTLHFGVKAGVKRFFLFSSAVLITGI